MNLIVEGQHSYLYLLLNYIIRELHKGCLCKYIVRLTTWLKTATNVFVAEITQHVFCFS